MSLAALRSLFTSCVAPHHDQEPDDLHRHRQGHLGPVVREFLGQATQLVGEIHRHDVQAVLSTPDLILATRPGGQFAHRERRPSTATPLKIVAVPHREAAAERRLADACVHVLPVHGGVPEPDELMALVERLDRVQDLNGRGRVHSRTARQLLPSLAAACSTALLIRDTVRDDGRECPRDDPEIVRAACLRLPLDVRTQLRAEEIAALLAFTFHCKVSYLSPVLGSATVLRPRPASPDAGPHRSPEDVTGTRSWPPR